VTVRVFQIDVSRRDEVKTLIRDVSGTMPPLKGIFHAAATLADGCMDGLNPSEFERVWVPKAAGAFHLHEETLNLLIEWFVLYSSFSVVAGNQGQASYTAANAFMDGLARHRRSLGLPATSVRWGAFGKAGMVARQPSVARLLETQGLRLMTPPVALDALLENEAREAACPIIADVDWTRWTESRRSSRWLVEDMLGSAAFSENINGAGTKARLDRLDQQTRRRSLQELIVRQTSEILRMAPEHIDIRRPLTEQGMDSLMGAELLAGVQMTLDVEITQMDLIKHNSVEDFTSLLDNRLSPTNGKAHDKTVTNSSTVLPDVDHV
jgi:myxalamid-type polyketide synthase MxaE and MxaD